MEAAPQFVMRMANAKPKFPVVEMEVLAVQKLAMMAIFLQEMDVLERVQLKQDGLVQLILHHHQQVNVIYCVEME